MNGTYGHILKRLLGYYDRDLLSWKMYEATLDLGFQKSSLTLPLLGMMQDGDLYELVMLARPIEEKDYLSLPTPLAHDGIEPSPAAFRRINPDLPAKIQIILLPTPTAMHVRNHEEPIEKYEQRVLDYEEGRTKGKSGPSLGLALRWTKKEYRLHWIKVD